MDELVRRAALAGHQSHCEVCAEFEVCPGPSSTEVAMISAALLSALSSASVHLHTVLRTAITKIEDTQLSIEPIRDASGQDPEELLLRWFRWWRDDDRPPVKLPGGLHVETAAYLTARAVQQGRKINSANDL